MRFTVKEAAQVNETTCQAIYNAIKKNHLKAYKDGTKMMVERSDLEEYRKMKYSRKKTKVAGKLVFNNEKGFYSINQAANEVGIPAPNLYYAIKRGLLKAKRAGALWVLYLPDVLEYKEKLQKKQTKGEK